MIKRKHLILFFVSLTFALWGCCQKFATIKLQTEKTRLPDTLLLNIQVTSGNNYEIKVPYGKNVKPGYKGDKDADYYFEVKELKGISETEVEPTTDYQYLNKRTKDPLIHLGSGNSINYKFNLPYFYKLSNDKKYKIRLIFNLSKFNSVDNVFSDWIIVNQ